MLVCWKGRVVEVRSYRIGCWFVDPTKAERPSVFIRLSLYKGMRTCPLHPTELYSLKVQREAGKRRGAIKVVRAAITDQQQVPCSVD
jgi:hypothetical protein